MPEFGSFEEIREEFEERWRRIVWCSVTTVDRKGRPRGRVLHPLWEGSTGWIMTGRNSFKTKHLAKNPYVSLAYVDPETQTVYADCQAEWADELEEKKRLWDLFRDTPPPVGYDPTMFWKSPEVETFGLLKLTPWRLEVWGVREMMAGKQARVWRPG